jgi:hypothetical protein
LADIPTVAGAARGRLMARVWNEKTINPRTAEQTRILGAGIFALIGL